MRNFFSKIINWVRDYQNDIILVIGVILISLLSFATGYIAAKQQEKEPLKFEETIYESSSNWGGDKRTLSCLETFSKRTPGNGF